MPLLGNSFACYADVGISAWFATTPRSRIWPLTPTPFHLAPFNLKTTTSCSWLPHDFTVLNKDTASQMKHQIQGQELKGELKTLPFFSSLIQTQLKHENSEKNITGDLHTWCRASRFFWRARMSAWKPDEAKTDFSVLHDQFRINISILLDLISCKYKPNLRIEKQLAVCSKTTIAHEHFSYGNWSPPFHIPSLIMLQKFLELHCSL